jgi:hypothetical protein
VIEIALIAFIACEYSPPRHKGHKETRRFRNAYQRCFKRIDEDQRKIFTVNYGDDGHITD